MNDIKRLEEMLLGLGGKRAVLLLDPDPAVLLERGRIFDAAARKRVRGRRHDGNASVAVYYLTRRHFGGGRCDIVAGYGLHGRLWLPHVWGWDGTSILETCGGFAAYFGYILDDASAASFVLREAARLLPAGPSFTSNISCSFS
jgi:hypothetical protein